MKVEKKGDTIGEDRVCQTRDTVLGIILKVPLRLN
jgi:hypothetical protein